MSNHVDVLIRDLFNEYSDYIVLKNSGKEHFARIFTKEKEELLIKAISALVKAEIGLAEDIRR